MQHHCRNTFHEFIRLDTACTERIIRPIPYNFQNLNRVSEKENA